MLGLTREAFVQGVVKDHRTGRDFPTDRDAITLVRANHPAWVRQSAEKIRCEDAELLRRLAE